MEKYIEEILQENKQIVTRNSQLLESNQTLKEELRTFYAGIEKYQSFKKEMEQRQNNQENKLK